MRAAGSRYRVRAGVLGGVDRILRTGGATVSKVYPLRLFKYTVEAREVPWSEPDAGPHPGRRQWIVTCREPGEGYEPFEMAPTFSELITASEIAKKASRGDEYCTSIPCVPLGSPVPRPPNLVFAPGRHEGANGACPRCGK